MWSLKQGLVYYKKHLPAGFNAAHGVKSLFPSGYKGSISPLKGYVFSKFSRVATPYNFGGADQYFGSAGNFFVMADGAGRWFYSWTWWPVSLNTGYKRQSGFVFKFSNDGNGHGFVDSTNPSSNVKDCASGTDPWIVQNWPAIFKEGALTMLQDGSAPVASQVWTAAGFSASQFVPLSGGSSACVNTPSGSALFPFPHTPFKLLSPLSVILGNCLGTGGLLLGQNLSTIPPKLVGKNGLTYHLTVPPGLKPGDSGKVSVTYASADNKINGSFVWTYPSLLIEAKGNVQFKSPKGSYAVQYNYSTSLENSELPQNHLTNTVNFKGNDHSASTLNQTVVNGAITAQTMSSTDTGGNTSTTNVTIEPDGTVNISGPGPVSPATLGVTLSPAQNTPLIAQVTSPVVGFITSIADTWGTSTGTTTISGTAPGPYNYSQTTAYGTASGTLTIQNNSDGTLSSYTVTSFTNTLGGTLSGSMTITMPTSTNSTVSTLSINGTFPVSGNMVTISYDSSFNISTGTTETQTTTITDQNGGSTTNTYTANTTLSDGSSSSSQTTSTDAVGNTTTTDQAFTNTDSAGNTSTVQVTFNPDGSFSLQINSTDAAGNGTTDNIQGDAQGNVVNEITGVTGDGGGGNIAFNDGGDDSGDDDGNSDGGDPGTVIPGADYGLTW